MYSLKNNLFELSEWCNPVIDTHLHFWNEKLIPFFFTWANQYFKQYSVVSMMLPELIPKIPEEYKERIIIAQFLTTKNLGEYNKSELIKQIDQAYSDGVEVFKLWLAPRFLDFNKLKGPFNLLNDKLNTTNSNHLDTSNLLNDKINNINSDIHYFNKKILMNFRRMLLKYYNK